MQPVHREDDVEELTATSLSGFIEDVNGTKKLFPQRYGCGDALIMFDLALCVYGRSFQFGSRHSSKKNDFYCWGRDQIALRKLGVL